jgi:hypothetical protein
MKKYSLSTLAAALLLCPAAHAYIDLVSLGSPTFSVAGEATTASYTQTTEGIVFNGTYVLGNTLGGTFDMQNWSDPAFTSFAVKMTLTGTNPNLPFSVQFYDGDFNVINTYNATTVGILSTPTYVPLTLGTSGTGILTSVVGVQFTWDGDGAINTTVQGVAAVPEPSTYALLALAGFALGGYAMRRRNRS